MLKLSKRTIILFALFITATLGFSQTQAFEIQDTVIPSIPSNVDSLLEIRDSLATTPEGGAAFFVLAMYLKAMESDLAMPAFTIGMDSSQLRNDPRGYRGFSPSASYNDFINRYLPRAPYIAFSYFQGALPENGYAVGNTDLVVQTIRNPYSEIAEDEIKVFVYSGGADTPRPITLKRNNRGLWKAKNSNSLFVGVRAPEVDFDDDL